MTNLDYTPQDALRYLDEATPLDYISERFSDLFGNDNDGFDNPEHERLASFIESACNQIRNEARVFSAGQDPDRYSNGVPVHTELTEIVNDPDGQPYAVDVFVTNHPATGTRLIHRPAHVNDDFDGLDDMQLPDPAA